MVFPSELSLPEALDGEKTSKGQMGTWGLAGHGGTWDAPLTRGISAAGETISSLDHVIMNHTAMPA